MNGKSDFKSHSRLESPTVITAGKTVAIYQVPQQAVFSLKEAARYLGTSPDTLRGDSDEGKVPSYVFHGRRVFLIEELDRYRNSLPKYQPAAQPESLRHQQSQCQNPQRPIPASSERELDDQ